MIDKIEARFAFTANDCTPEESKQKFREFVDKILKQFDDYNIGDSFVDVVLWK